MLSTSPSSADGSMLTEPSARPATPAPWFDLNGGRSVNHSSSAYSSASSRFFFDFSDDGNGRTSKLDPNSKPFLPRIVSERALAQRPDDFGLRGLSDMIADSKRSFRSPLCTVIDPADLGYPASDDPSINVRRSNHFESPFSDSVLGALNDFYYVPDEYCHSSTLADRLPLPGMQYWPTDLLFFLFYTAVGEALQIVAGYNLFDRGWRFNKLTGTWLARIPNLPPEERSFEYERGTYQYFDVASWTRLNGKFTLYYQELSERFGLPEHYKGFYASSSASVQQNNAQLQQQLQQQRAAAQKRKEAAAMAYLRSIKAAMAAQNGIRY